MTNYSLPSTYTVFEAVPNGIMITDAVAEDMPIVYVNRAFEELTGYPSDEVIGKNCRFLQGTDKDQPQLHDLRTALQQGQACRVTLRNYRKDGSLFWNELNISPVYDEIDTLKHFLGVLNDVTAHKQTELSQKQTEERFRQLIENNKDAYFLYALDGTYLYAYTPSSMIHQGQDLIGRKPVEVTDYPNAVKIMREIQHVAATGETLFVESHRYVNGSDVWFAETVYPVFDEDGSVSRVAKTSHNITTRKEIELELQYSEARNRALLDSIPDTILRVDFQGKFIDYIPSDNVDLGFSEEQLLHSTIDELFPEDIAEETLLTIRAAYLTGMPQTLEFQLDYTAYSRHYEARIVATDQREALILVRDITARKHAKQMEQEQQALSIELQKEREFSELKSRFISMANHELRTPMAIIQASSDLIERYIKQDGNHQAQVKEQIRRIRDACHNLMSLTEDVLTVGRAEAGQLAFKPTAVNVRELCATIFSEIEELDHGRHQFTFVWKGGAERLQADPNLLRHICYNLISNATKYSPLNTTICHEAGHDGRMLSILIKDEGIGIPEEDQLRIFDPFHRAENVGNIQGTGLGLTIARMCVERHGGSIDFTSSPDNGTEFRIAIPARVVEASTV